MYKVHVNLTDKPFLPFTVSDNLYFNGTSFARMDLLRDPISALQESIRFRFKTSYANGIVLYSRGTQGDYIALQLKDNRMVLNLDLGSGIMTTLSVGSLLDDNVWHDVVISRNRRDILFSVDRVNVQGRIRGEFSRLNLNRAVSSCLYHKYKSKTFMDIKKLIFGKKLKFWHQQYGQK